ncbi:MAG: DUF1232 domain-containing protein [Blautia sp.]|nr:DUF1232 domain-containing protein [Blautia sp.]
MATDYSAILSNATEEAKALIQNPAKVKDVLAQAEQKVKELPGIGEAVADVPVMFSMVKSWITKEYAVSPKVLATLVGAFLYLIKKQDLISDNIPVLGLADDIAILGLALSFISPDVKAYKEWKQSH